MKVARSSTCSLRFATSAKRAVLRQFLEEYGAIVNRFIEIFWKQEELIGKSGLLKPVIDFVIDSGLLYNPRQIAAREALDLCQAAKRSAKATGRPAKMPCHQGKSIQASALIAKLKTHKTATNFDCWLEMRCLGKGFNVDLPIKLHKHFHHWNTKGKRLSSYVINVDSVQFAFEVETGPKVEAKRLLGVDTGVNTLAATSDGELLGTESRACIERIKRCKHGSKGQKRARRTLRHLMDKTAREVVNRTDFVVVERLKGIGHGTKVKGRLTKNVRSSIGAWNYAYWLKRLKMTCEENRVSFRSVNPWNTSVTCPVCANADRTSRRGEMFRCTQCGHTDHADVNAARNILVRGLQVSGNYRSGVAKCADMPYNISE